MQDPAEPVMEVVLFARQDGVEARGVPRMPTMRRPGRVDVRAWCGLSERIADHEDVRLRRLQSSEPVEDL